MPPERCKNLPQRSAKSSRRDRSGQESGNASNKSLPGSLEKSSLTFGAREEPPPEFKDQSLFLLEFFVHRLTGHRLAKLNQMFFVPTSVRFEFLDFHDENAIEITPVDPFFQPQAGIADAAENFYSGRSVMFAVDQETVTKKNLDFVVGLCVRKRMPDGIMSDVHVGSGQIDLTKCFAALRKETLQCWHRNVPPPKTFEGDVPLCLGEEEVGTAEVYIRMSAFGQTIVTEFDAPATERTPSCYVFRGDATDAKRLTYKCRVIDSENVCFDSATDLREGETPCRVCMPEKFPCLPCGYKAGAGEKADRQREERRRSMYEPASYPPTKETKTATDLCADVRNVGPIQTSRGPAQPCGKAVVLKVSGLLDTGDDKKKPTVTVAPPSDAIGPDTPQDPDHDVFILRIGKKGLVGAGEKSDIQLEMRTPKGAEKGPPVRHETREMQTEEDVKEKKDRKGRKRKK